MNKEQLTDFLGVLHFHGYIDHDASKLGDLADMADFTTPPHQTVSAEDILAEEISEMSDEEFNNNANELLKLVKPFTPERTATEEAERLVKVLLNDTKCWLDEAVKIAIIDQQNTITALKAANVSTVWHEEVLTILKGM